MNLDNLALYVGRVFRLGLLPFVMLVQRPFIVIIMSAFALVVAKFTPLNLKESAFISVVLLYLIELTPSVWRHKGKILFAMLGVVASLYGLRSYLISHDECRGYTEIASHPLRAEVGQVLYTCLDGKSRSVRLAMENGLDAARVEKELTVWFDCDPLVEFLAANLPLIPASWVRTFGPCQVHYLTAQEVYKRYRHEPLLNAFLGIETAAESEELVTTSSKRRIVEGLKLRCRGSIILGHLLVNDLWMGLENGTDRATMPQAVETTRQALVAAKSGRKFHNVTDNATLVEQQAARDWIQGSLNLRIQPRLGIYVISAYAGGLEGGRDADVQACLNEWQIVRGRPTELMPVDGDWGPETEEVVTEFLGRPAGANETHAQRREAVWATWRAEVEPRLYTLLISVILSGNPGPLMPLLKNRYVGHVAVYNALDGMLATLKEQKREDQLLVSHDHVAKAWEGWASNRDAQLWRYLTDRSFFENTFPPATQLHQEFLVRMAAQWFLITRLTPRQLHFEVKMIFRVTWKSQENLLLRLRLFAKRKDWLIDVPPP